MDVTHFTHSVECDGLTVHYDLCLPGKGYSGEHKCDNFLLDEDSDYQQRIAAFEEAYSETLAEIERLTYSGDGLDLAMAVSSGLITGLLDVFLVGEWNFKDAKALSNQQMNEKVMDFAKKNGYKGDRLSGAVAFLEDKFPFPGDNTWSGEGIHVSTQTHHLDDFKHHPTLVGLICSILDQFTKTSTYHNRFGDVAKIPMAVDENGMLEGKTPTTKVSAGIINWCFTVAKQREGHLVSDMAGSKQTAGKGMGLPGGILSTLRELAALPGLRDTDFALKLTNAYQNGFGTGKGQVDLGVFNSLFEGAESNRLDMRTEGAIKHELGRQSMPVILNEVVVRSFYFVRHFTTELKITGDVDLIDWKKVLPIRNRTIVRMMTISIGTMEVVDLVDAAARSGGALPVFVLRVNFVGIGRFAIAGTSDIMMGVKKERLELAMASAEVAKTAHILTSTIRSVDNQRSQTRQLLNEVTNRTNGHPVQIRRESMGYTIHDIQVDTNIFTLEDVMAAADQIFDLQENEFNTIRKEKWYHDFKRAITFHADDRKRMIADITSISKLQQLFMLVYARYFESLDADVAETIAEVGKTNQKIYKLYETCVAKIELQEDIRSFLPHERGILHLFLCEYESQSGNEDKFQRYRRQIIRLLGDVEPTSTFDAAQLAEIHHPGTFYRCACELCAIDGKLNDRKFPDKVVKALEELDLSAAKCRKIEASVMRQAEKLGTSYFWDEKYQSDDFSAEGIVLVDHQEHVSIDYPQEEATAEGLTDKRIYIAAPKNSVEKNAVKLLRIKLEDTPCKLVKSVEEAQYKIFFPSSNGAENIAKIAIKPLYENEYGCAILRSKTAGKNIYLKYEAPDEVTDTFRESIITAYEEQTDDVDLKKAIDAWISNHSPKEESEYFTLKAKVAVDDASQAARRLSEELMQAKATDKKSVLPTIGKKVGGGVLRVGSALVQGINTGGYWVNSKIEAASDKGKTSLADSEFDKKVIPEIQCKILVERLFDMLVSGEI